MFSCEFCEIFKNTFFMEHLRTTASYYWMPLFNQLYLEKFQVLHQKFLEIHNKTTGMEKSLLVYILLLAT